MRHVALRVSLIFACFTAVALFAQSAAAKTLRVNPAGSGGCYSKIQSAVAAASNKDVINVLPGTYKEEMGSRPPLLL